MPITNEQTFETAILSSLVENGGYQEIPSDQYSPKLGMFKI